MSKTPSDAQSPLYTPVRAPRGSTLTCKGWQQEAVLRMLLNSLDPDAAEQPSNLVISGASGTAAADWPSFHSIVAALRQLGNDETLSIASGKLASVERTDARSPRVRVISHDATDRSGDWLYAGTQTALPVLCELYAAAAHRYWNGTLAGKLVVGGGMGGAGGAQPLAAALNGAAFLGIEADAERIKRRVKSGYCDVMVNNLDESLRMLKNAVRQRKSVSIGLIGNCAELLPELAERGVVPDLLTNFTPSHQPFDGYIPAGMTAAVANDARHADEATFRQRVQESLASHRHGLVVLEKLGTRVIQPADMRDYLRPLIEDDGRRLAIWLALSGEPGDISSIDKLALERFPGDKRLQHWLPLAGRHVRFQGLPARVCWLRLGDVATLGRSLNDLVSRGELKAPVFVGCRLPCPESESDAAPASPGIENGACWTYSMSRHSVAQAFVADGTADADERFAN